MMAVSLLIQTRCLNLMPELVFVLRSSSVSNFPNVHGLRLGTALSTVSTFLGVGEIVSSSSIVWGRASLGIQQPSLGRLRILCITTLNIIRCHRLYAGVSSCVRTACNQIWDLHESSIPAAVCAVIPLLITSCTVAVK